LFIRIPVTDEKQSAEFLQLTPERYKVQQNGTLLTVEGFDVLRPHEKLAIHYTYTVKRRHSNAWRTRGFSVADTKPEHSIESDDKRVIKKAMELTDGKGTSDAKKARTFYDYVAGSIQFNTHAGDAASRSAVECLEAQGGVCGHKANLLTALCRASSIPARSVSGLTLPRKFRAAPNRAGSHAWNEIYIKGQGWCFADPTYGSSLWNRKRYWGDYDLYRVIVEPDADHRAFDSVAKNLEEKSSVTCQIQGPCYVMLTVLGRSDHNICILGDKLQVTVKPLRQ
jgi:hypothetical protein